MKKTHLFIALFILLSGLVSCQTIVNMHDNSYPINEPNTYYKDIGNKLNLYEGTWVYDNGTSYIKIILQKKIKFPVLQYFEDTLIGGFQYKKNGVEIINTLNLINSNFNDPIKYPISGNRFGDTSLPSIFEGYTSDNTRLSLTVRENNCFSDMDVRILLLNGQPEIQIKKRNRLNLRKIVIP